MTDPRRQKIVDYALSQVGPGDVPHYWESCGIAYTPDIAKRFWCGVFALTCLHEADVATDIPWVVGLGFCAVPGRALSTTKTPEPGDIYYVNEPWQHHGVVESLVDGELATVEGNTPTVQRRVRPLPKTGVTFYSIDRFLKAPTADTLPAPPPVSTKPAPQKLSQPDATLVRGIDVSAHQSPDAVRWRELAKTHRFVVARATYGTRLDATFAEHVHRAREEGLVPGAYHFFRQGQDVQAQLDAFSAAAEHAGMGPGWLPPALDVESNAAFDGPVTAAGYAPAEDICKAWRARWGQALVYTNASTWALTGNPEWLRDYPLWVAHYGVAVPKTPLGLPWVIWQHTSSPLPGVMAGPLDQNVARRLPLLTLLEDPPLLPLEVDWEEFKRDRDAQIKEEE